MSQARSKRSRPLGLVRHSLTGIEAIPKLPPLTPSIDRNYEGILGNAMGVPPPRTSPEDTEHDNIRKTKTLPSPHRRGSLGQTEGSKVEDSRTEKRELKEALDREKQLSSQITSLQKVIEGLKVTIQEKVKVIKELQEQLIEQEEHYKSMYENEVRHHRNTRATLDDVEEQVFLKDEIISDLRTKYETKMKELDSMMEQRLYDLRTEKDAEIAVRDEKLKKLKYQMADALRGNSWERQQQLDELSKELTRAQEEADMLRVKLKSLTKNGKGGATGSCSSCESLSARVEQLDRALQDRDRIIRELKSVCSRFEKQLGQQDQRQFDQNRTARQAK